MRALRRFLVALRGIAGWAAAVLGMVAIALLVADSSLGHRLAADRIAMLRLQSGLGIAIGRIDGSLFGRSVLHDVVLSDPQGRFMTVPEIDLEWRPVPALRLVLGLGGGLDIRDLTLHRASLIRAPQLNPADPNSPILPDFDVRIDHLGIDAMTVAPGLAGARRRIDWAAHADIRQGRVIAAGAGRLGGQDRLQFDLASEPDRDTFRLALDLRAPAGGLLAGLTRLDHGLDARIAGEGRFARWHGWMVVRSNGHRIAGGTLDQSAGAYRLAMLLRPAIPALGGDPLGLTFAGTFGGGRIDGRYRLAHAIGDVAATGAIDLAHNRAQAIRLNARLLRPERLPAQWRDLAHPGAGTISTTIDGPFSRLAIAPQVAVSRIEVAGVGIDRLTATGTGQITGGKLDLALTAAAGRVGTGNPWLDQDLAGVRLAGHLRADRGGLSGDGLRLSGRALAANLALKFDAAHVALAIAGRVDARGLAVPVIGTIDGTAKGVLALGRSTPWTLSARYATTLARYNPGVAMVAGPRAQVAGGLHWGAGRALTMPDAAVRSDRLNLAANLTYGRDRHLAIAASGTHATLGAVSGRFDSDPDALSASARMARVVPHAGVTDGRIDLASAGDGYRLTFAAASPMGPVNAAMRLAGTGDRRTIDLDDARIGDTRISGRLALAEAGPTGDLALAGGGIEGTLHLAPRDGGQAVDAALAVHGARFGSDHPVTVALARVNGGLLLRDGAVSARGTVQAEGIASGSLFIGRLLADADVAGGSGRITASLAGRRGTRLALQGTATISPGRYVLYVAGDYAGNAITMPRRAVIEHDEAGWRLQPSQVNFGSGAVIADGRLGAGADPASALHLAVSRMPLSALDIVYANLGLGGYASGVIDYRNDHAGAPEGHAALTVMGLTRSGLVLTSRPLDLSLVAALRARDLQLRAIAREGAVPRMRLSALVSDLPRGGSTLERLRGGALHAHLRYAGPADALWRLAAIDAFDLTGPVGVAADMAGSIDAPVLTGAVVSHALRAQSAISGSDIRAIDLVGSFNGAQLSLARFTGTTPGGGRIAGSGSIDFSDATSERPKLDLRLGATNADLVNRPEMGATISGPMRIVSDGISGTIAGRLHIDKARWVLGRMTAVQALPTITVVERNTRADIAPPPPRGAPWKLLIDAGAASRIDVHGMGLESEWQTDLKLRGDTANPQVYGSADVIRGSYEFAGKRFDLTRGRIRFNGELPIDPQLDIVATGDANDISATITIAGSSQRPQITFASTPALPEEELLSRILFGSSIAQISAPEAVQLAAALAALRGGAGIDPINRLRGAIGLDRLRVLSADPTINRGTAIAVGKYLGRRFFIELVTDGHGYSASSVEFRLTRWLSLLGTLSTVYDDALTLKLSKDY